MTDVGDPYADVPHGPPGVRLYRNVDMPEEHREWCEWCGNDGWVELAAGLCPCKTCQVGHERAAAWVEQGWRVPSYAPADVLFRPSAPWARSATTEEAQQAMQAAAKMGDRFAGRWHEGFGTEGAKHVPAWVAGMLSEADTVESTAVEVPNDDGPGALPEGPPLDEPEPENADFVGEEP